MRLGTIFTEDGARTVALVDGRHLELDRSVPELLEAGREAIEAAIKASRTSHFLEERPLGPAVHRPGKILCIGRNYAEHAKELGNETPARPEVFVRTLTSLAAPHQDVVRPAVSEQMDYEVELAVVIGRGGRYIKAEEAMGHVGGYCVFNDISIRDFQLAGSQWTPGKNFDGTGPLGPYVVTADEISDPHALELSTTIIGADGGEEAVQRSSTSLMVHRIPELIAFLSTFTTLEPGDVIATGTPGGVGMARSPQRWLVPGETVKCVVEKIGEIHNRVVTDTTDSA